MVYEAVESVNARVSHAHTMTLSALHPYAVAAPLERAFEEPSARWAGWRVLRI